MIDPIAVLIGFLVGWFVLVPLSRIVYRRYGLAAAVVAYILGTIASGIVYSAIKAVL